MASYYKKYQRLQKYQEDKPVTPSEYKKGEMIETVKCNTKADCQNDVRIYERIERVENAPYDEIECRANGAYLPQYLSYSVDNGQTWIKTKEIVNYIKIMDNSDVDYCNNVDMVRYIIDEGQYACDSKGNLVYKYKKQIKKGDVWEDVIPLEYYNYDKCPHYEEDSWECNPPSYLTEKQIQKVVENPETTYECVDPNTETAVKWSVYREDETTDNGETWTEGTALTKYKKYEINSYDCGWVDSFEVKSFYIDYYAAEEDVKNGLVSLYDEFNNWTGLPFQAIYAYNTYTNQPAEINTSGNSIKVNTVSIYRVYFISLVKQNVINEQILNLSKPWLSYSNVYSIDVDFRTIVGDKIKLSFDRTVDRGFFVGCKYLTYVHPDFFQIYSDSNTLQSTFRDCIRLKTVEPTLFKNFTKCTNITALFMNSNITALPEGIFDDFTNVIEAKYALAHCDQLGSSSLPDNLFYNMESLQDIGGLFYYSSGIKTLPRYCFKNNKNIKNTIVVYPDQSGESAFQIDYDVENKKFVYNVNCDGPFDIDTDGNEVPFCHRSVGTPGYQTVGVEADCIGCNNQ